ncbi:TRAP transporter small permease [Roseibium suaedae]|uniref:TRAP transporter small permease protein n=1 Tax=Roseibium suaedae TaxID=735517 RepID=A0A1M7HQE8_9HYPH|nr:TRAP transporter small permease [Roseibium suaedae]SHM30746.1 TRAP-type C4-dicarboxylate transport system, small permease component [Roseibium suaedae]
MIATSLPGRFIKALASGTALAGGAVLIAIVLMTCASVTGRALSQFGLGPIEGDFELVEIGIGFAVFCSLPWCHLQRGHATVELLTGRFSARTNKWIDVICDLLFLLMAALIAWRLWLGMLDKKSYFETTFILQLQVWQAYAACMFGAVVLTIVSVYQLGCSLKRAVE